MLFGPKLEQSASPFELRTKQAAEDSKNSLKKQFKGVFQNVSKVRAGGAHSRVTLWLQLLDCVACQKCKLHGKIALMGVGTALKVLVSEF